MFFQGIFFFIRNRRVFSFGISLRIALQALWSKKTRLVALIRLVVGRHLYEVIEAHFGPELSREKFEI